MKELALRRLAVAFAATLAACGGGEKATQDLSGSTAVLPPPSPAPAPPPVTPPPPPAPPAPVPAPPAAGSPTVAQFAVAAAPSASGATPSMVGGSMTRAGDGNVWFTDGIVANDVGKITPDGTVSFPVTSAIPFHLGTIAGGPDGNVWFGDPVAGITIAGTIGSIDIVTGIAVEYATPLMTWTTQTSQSTSQDQSCTAATMTHVATCTPVLAGSCVPSVTNGITCTTTRAGPTPVLACSAAAGSAANSYVTTTCATAVSTPVSASTCSVVAPTAGNAYTTTLCSGITPGSQAYAVAKGPDGNIWFTEYVAPRIGKYDVMAGKATEYGPLQGPATAITGGPDGNVWFTENMASGAAPAIGRVTPDGVVVEFTDGFEAGQSLGAIVTGGDGNLWFTKRGTGGTAIGTLVVSTGAVTFYGTGIAGASPLLGGLALGPDGNVWFTDYYDALVGRITPAGVITEYGNAVPNSALNAIVAGSATASPNTLWVTEPDSNQIGRLTLP